MTTNIERAARILHDLAAQESAEDGFPKPQWEAEPVWEKNVWIGVAQALADAGLLMPDLPKPKRWGKNGEPEWDACAITVSPSGYEGRVIVEDVEGRWEASSADIRALGLALLAAADYAERNHHEPK